MIPQAVLCTIAVRDICGDWSLRCGYSDFRNALTVKHTGECQWPGFKKECKFWTDNIWHTGLNKILFSFYLLNLKNGKLCNSHYIPAVALASRIPLSILSKKITETTKIIITSPKHLTLEALKGKYIRNLFMYKLLQGSRNFPCSLRVQHCFTEWRGELLQLHERQWKEGKHREGDYIRRQKGLQVNLHWTGGTAGSEVRTELRALQAL